MANPPITIGPFNNVPAPGSPIRSDWAQQISQYVTDMTGTLSSAIVTGEVEMFSGGSVAAISTLTFPTSGLWLLLGSALCVNRTSPSALTQGTVQMRVANTPVGMQTPCWLGVAFDAVPVPLFAFAQVTAGARAVDILGTTASGRMFVGARQIIAARVG